MAGIGEALDTEAAARMCAISESTLEKWRVSGVGPPFLKLGRLVRYARCDLESWLNDHRVRSTSEQVKAG